MGVLIFSLFLFLLAFPLGEISRFTYQLTISFTLLDVVVGLGSISWLFVQIVKKNYPKSDQAKLFLAVIGVFVLSLLLNAQRLSMQQVLASGLYIVRFTAYGVLFFMFQNLNTWQRKSVKVFLFFSGLILLLGGFVQYFFYPALRNLYYSGWDEHLFRMFSTFFDPNFFGLFLAAYFLFVVFLALKQNNKVYAISLFAVALVTLVGIALTYSRTAFLAVFAGLLILFWDKVNKKNFWISLIILFAISGAILGFLSRKSEGTNLFRSVSTDARLGSAKNALVIFNDSPLFGVGFNAYRYSQYAHHFMPSNIHQEDHGASGADSSILLVLATSGIVGFLVFCAFLWSHVRSLLINSNRLGLATFVAVFVGSFFVNGLFYPSILVWLWVILGISKSGEQ